MKVVSMNEKHYINERLPPAIGRAQTVQRINQPTLRQTPGHVQVIWKIVGSEGFVCAGASMILSTPRGISEDCRAHKREVKPLVPGVWMEILFWGRL